MNTAERKKPGPKPKPKAIVIPTVKQVVPFQAVESNEYPLTKIEVKRIVVRKLTIGHTEYFMEASTKKMFTSEHGRPGEYCGYWNPELQLIDDVEET